MLHCNTQRELEQRAACGPKILRLHLNRFSHCDAGCYFHSHIKVYTRCDRPILWLHETATILLGRAHGSIGNVHERDAVS